MMAPPLIGLSIASVLSSALYGFWQVSKPPSLVKTSLKTLAVGSIAAGVWLSGHAGLLALGLALSATGDGILAAASKSALPLGLLSFLLAHAAYIVVFAHAGGGILMFRSEPVRIAGLLVSVSAAVLVVRLIWRTLGSMAGPVLIYVLTMVAMTTSAFALPWIRWPVMAGAMAFFASDGVLALRLFRYDAKANRTADLAVWWLYYAGQTLIAAGFVFKGNVIPQP